MTGFKNAIRTTVLLVDDDAVQLQLRALAMKFSGLSVVTATVAAQAISMMDKPASLKIGVAVIDYHMPIMNGCVLAEYLKSRRPELKIVLYSGAIGIPETEMSSVDAFVSKSEGTDCLLDKIAEVQTVNPELFHTFRGKNNIEARAAR